MKKINVKDITEGALYVACYGILALISRYLITGVDSMIYYIYPLPMAIYSSRKSFRISLIAALAGITLSFLFANPLYVLILMMPNIIGGLILGSFLKRTPKQIITYLVVFIIFLFSDFFSIWLFEKINNIGYWDDIVDWSIKILRIFASFDEEILKKVLISLFVVVIIVDSLIKLVFNVLIFFLIVSRLNLVKDIKIGFKIPLRYSPIIGIIFVILFLGTYITLIKFISMPSNIIEVLFTIFIALYFILSIYIMYQVVMYFRIKFKKLPMWSFIFIVLFAFILFPITHLIGIFLNLLNYNYIKDAL